MADIRPPVTRSDIDEIKASQKEILAETRSLADKLLEHATAQKSFEEKITRLDLGIYGDGTADNPGHIAKTNARLYEIERVQGSYSKAVWAIVTPLLGLLGLGIIYMLVQVAVK